MKLDKLVGERFKERPSDCVMDSHALMVRGGYIKPVANGIYSSFMIQRRIAAKIERIIREEMDAIDGQEVVFPVVMPASLWEQSGRYQGVGSELARFEDRNGSPMVLGMTHEEAAVHLVREYGRSYAKYPFMVYQLQTKFRDEARPRAGLIRVREFTMKDAYSFHTSQEDLEDYYEKCYQAYVNVFTRAGIPEVISVASDSGMMGGKIAHEFMLLAPSGEDSLALCTNCDFRANQEAAQSIIKNEDDSEAQIELKHTPGMQTIEDVCNFLGASTEKSCKAVVYQKNADDAYVVVFIRGDLDINETKLTNLLCEAVHPAVIDESSGLNAGYIGPYGLSGDFTVLYDNSLLGMNNFCCGANKEEYHYVGVNMARDIGNITYHDLAKIKEGGICPECSEPAITIKRGIEVGNIFQLGTKYTKSMGMQFLDSEGVLNYPIMGCYGIGVGRLAASVCEARHDEHGPIWPMAIAPWQVHLCCVRSDVAEVKQAADALYKSLMDQKVEVIYDDRQVSAGVIFSDADLLGVPLRVTVSPRNMKENICEITSRDKTLVLKVPYEETAEKILGLIEEMS